MVRNRDSSFFELIEKGALSELSGPRGGGKTEAVLRFIAEAGADGRVSRVAWIERDFTVYPCAFPLHQVALERVLFVDAGRDPRHALWAAQQVLASQVFGIVVLGLGEAVEDPVVLRRLQLAAEKAQATVVFLSETATATNWPFRLKARVEPSGVTILKSRKGGDACPSTEKDRIA